MQEEEGGRGNRVRETQINSENNSVTVTASQIRTGVGPPNPRERFRESYFALNRSRIGQNRTM